MQLSPVTSSRTTSSLLEVLTNRRCSFFLEHPAALLIYGDTYFYVIHTIQVLAIYMSSHMCTLWYTIYDISSCMVSSGSHYN